MAKIIHSFKNQKIEKSTKDDVSFILTNKKGSYVYLAEEPTSRYQGFFFFENFRMYKVIENINLVDEPRTKIINNFCSIERKRKSMIESFFMPRNFNSLVYDLNKEGEIEITLDVKESYDSRVWGRYYEILEEKGCIIIKFTKRTDNKEDNSHGFEEYVLYLAIKSENNNFEKIEKWVEHYYKLDEKRNSVPLTRYVFYALKLKGKKLVFSVSKSKTKAIMECNYVFKNSNKIENTQEKIFNENILNNNKNILKKIKSKERKFAYIAAVNSLNSLIIDSEKMESLFAGIPWFFQFWSRDAAISLGALEIQGNVDLEKKVLFNMLKSMQDNGRVLNIDNGYKNAPSNTVDGTGWIFFRLYELYSKNKLSKKEINLVKNKLLKSIKLSEYRITEDGFEQNEELETWMDTSTQNGEDTRGGVRIEIQALRLIMYKFAYELAKNKNHRNKEIELRKVIKEKFWNKKILADGLNDFTIRPNVFIAYYVYPDLLSKKEWEKCFQNILPSLWLKWGGLSTIDKKNHLFRNGHTGENTDSYHRGDSWFWLNNLTALVLRKLNKNRFRKYTSKILKASAEEILWKGAISHHSELSSASNLKSQGCLMQAWSNAMYIELIHELYK